MTEKNIPDKADRKRYHKFLSLWRVKFGLVDWRFGLSEKPAQRAAMADVKPFIEDRLATFRLGDFRNQPVNDYTLESAAVHEWLHVLLTELISVCRNPDTPEESIRSVEHRVVNVLEELLVPKPETNDGNT